MDDAMRLSVASLLRELLRGATDAMNRVKVEWHACAHDDALRPIGATDAMNRVKVEWVPLLFVGKHEPRSQKEVADAPTTVQKEEKGKLAKLFEEASDEAGIGPSALAVCTCLTECLRLPRMASDEAGIGWRCAPAGDLRRSVSLPLIALDCT